MERLTRWCDTNQEWRHNHTKDHEVLDSDIMNKLAEYENAERQGLLVRLPCNVGDKIYALELRSSTGIEVVECKQIRLNKSATMFRGGRCKYHDWGAAFWAFDLKDYKATWFTSETEALQALKERE